MQKWFRETLAKQTPRRGLQKTVKLSYPRGAEKQRKWEENRMFVAKLPKATTFFSQWSRPMTLLNSSMKQVLPTAASASPGNVGGAAASIGNDAKSTVFTLRDLKRNCYKWVLIRMWRAPCLCLRSTPKYLNPLRCQICFRKCASLHSFNQERQVNEAKK